MATSFREAEQPDHDMASAAMDPTKPVSDPKLWHYHVLRLYAQERLDIADGIITPSPEGVTARSRFEQFYNWMMEDDASDSNDTPLLDVSIRNALKEETFSLLVSRNYFDEHRKSWWTRELEEIRTQHEAARKVMREEPQKRKRRGRLDAVGGKCASDKNSDIDSEEEDSNVDTEEYRGADPVKIDLAKSSDKESAGKELAFRADSHQGVAEN